MKKIFAILTTAALMTACNSAAEKTTTTITDSAVINESPLMDAVNTADSVNKIIDSTGKLADTSTRK
ncbi:MAG TPA: hypothetical protein VK489_13905 [Ferruginibacter sp.]|nr:hypothetical protein [Ferruginibacter sp.]